ncbi:MAG: hypothetical protein ABI867_25645 [Kofleriaceae bacterium]
MVKKPQSPPADPDLGAPVPKDKIDPDMVKLRRPRARVGIITALGICILCGYFLVRLSPDRRFGGESEKPTAVAMADVLADKVDMERFVELEAEPLVSHAMRTVKAKGDVGLRLVPARGTADRVWLALPGDSWDQPVITSRYSGRLRKLSDMKFAKALREFAAETPRPVFGAPAAIRAAFATGKLATVTHDEVTLTDGDRVAFELVEPNEATIIASFNERLPNAAAWLAALAIAEAPALQAEPKPVDEALHQGRFKVKLSAPVATEKLAAAKLFAARVEPVTTHHATTWGELKKSGAGGFTVGTVTVPDAQIDLVGVYAKRGLPDDAYVLITDEIPPDYWYVLYITVALALIGLLFAWALVRAVRRDLLPVRA